MKNLKQQLSLLQPSDKNEKEFLKTFVSFFKESFKKPSQLTYSTSHSKQLQILREGDESFQTKKQESTFEKMNHLLSPTIFLLKIPENTSETMSIQTLPFSHLIIQVGKNAKVMLLENFEKKESHSSLSNVELILEEGAHVTYLFPQTSSLQNHIFIKNASIKKNAELIWLPHVMNGNNLYTNIKTWLEHGSVKLYGTYFSKDMEKLYFNYRTDHTKAGFSNIEMYGISKDASSSHFYGNIHIEKQGKQANGNLKEQCLLFNKKAKHTTMPMLEIKTNDIQAKHASSTTKINEHHLFYLTSRGMTNKEATQQIIMSFLENALKYIPLEKEKEKMYTVLQKIFK